MPIYQYYCEKCAKEFEMKRLMADIDKPASCPTCGKKGSRLVTAFSSMVGLHLKTPTSKVMRDQPEKKAKTKKASKSKRSK